MHPIKKLIIAAALMANAELIYAQILPTLETVPTPNVGELKVEELGPVFAHPLAEDEPAVPTPKTAEKQAPNKDIRSLFEDDTTNKPGEQKNPLEEEAKNEMKAVDDSDAVKLPEQMVQIDGSKQQEVLIKAENTPKEIDLDGADPAGASLPKILR